jgi:hypothetical protein
LKKYTTPAWSAGSFWDHLGAAADAVGFENADIAWGIAQVPWESIEDREAFLDSITSPRTRDIIDEEMMGFE